MRVFFVTETKDFSPRLFLDVSRKYVKGFARLGHDTHVFSCSSALAAARPIRWRRFSRFWWAPRGKELLLRQIRLYQPDLVVVNLPRLVDAGTIQLMRDTVPQAFFMGIDGEAAPERRLESVRVAAKLDLLLTVYDPKGQRILEDAGVKGVFMPFACDPDIEHRHSVGAEWQSDVIFTGKAKHRSVPTDPLRTSLVMRLAQTRDCAVHGCCGRAFLGGMDYYYAISGAKIGLSINLANDVPLYHSDRLTHYLACGALVLAKRVPDSERLFQDGVHLRYFDSSEEFLDLVARYLRDEAERERIARAGMDWTHQEYNCAKTTRYMLDAMETGAYRAPWMTP
jgi:glycosyltransferase involved in cell wall biosynthesis